MTTLCHLNDLEEGKSLGFASHLGPVFAVKRDGIVYVYQNECPHLHVNLEHQTDQFLDDEGALIQCSVHGALFEIETGACLSGPCQGDSLTPVKYQIRQGNICLP
jgi:nitrite reductase/ring-hydroxylating ferredoxin subunit